MKRKVFGAVLFLWGSLALVYQFTHKSDAGNTAYSAGQKLGFVIAAALTISGLSLLLRAIKK